MTVVLRVRPGYHIYAHEPGDRFLTATRLDPAPVDGIAFGSVRWPRAKRLKGALVHEGDVRFSLPFSVARGARPGLRRITLNAFAQGCNATDCYPPARFSLTATVRIG